MFILIFFCFRTCGLFSQVMDKSTNRQIKFSVSKWRPTSFCQPTFTKPKKKKQRAASIFLIIQWNSWSSAFKKKNICQIFFFSYRPKIAAQILWLETTTRSRKRGLNSWYDQNSRLIWTQTAVVHSHRLERSFEPSNKCPNPFVVFAQQCQGSIGGTVESERSLVGSRSATLSGDGGEPLGSRHIRTHYCTCVRTPGVLPRLTGAHARHRRWTRNTGSSFTPSLSSYP